MNIIIFKIFFSNALSLLFLRSRGIKLKIHNYEVPKLILMIGALCVKKTSSVTSHSIHFLVKCYQLPESHILYLASILLLAVLQLLRLSSGKLIHPCTQFVGPMMRQEMN